MSCLNQGGHDAVRRADNGAGGILSSGGISVPSRQPIHRDPRYYQQHARHHGTSMEKQPPRNDPSDLVKRALDFKTQATQCYKDKKYREAIGKYHRALLEMKGLCRVLGDPDMGSKSPTTVLSTTTSKESLTDEQKGAVENAELECYNSLAGKTHIYCSRVFLARIECCHMRNNRMVNV